VYLYYYFCVLLPENTGQGVGFVRLCLTLDPEGAHLTVGGRTAPTLPVIHKGTRTRQIPLGWVLTQKRRGSDGRESMGVAGYVDIGLPVRLLVSVDRIYSVAATAI